MIGQNKYGDVLITRTDATATSVAVDKPSSTELCALRDALQNKKIVVCKDFVNPPFPECSYRLGKNLFGNKAAFQFLPPIQEGKMQSAGLCFFIQDQKGQLWVLLHSSEKTQNRYVNPVTMCKRGETLQESAMRIFREETDLDISRVIKENNEDPETKLTFLELLWARVSWCSLPFPLEKHIFLYVDSIQNTESYTFVHWCTKYFQQKPFRIRDSQLRFFPVKELVEDSNLENTFRIIQTPHFKIVKLAYEMWKKNSSQDTL